MTVNEKSIESIIKTALTNPPHAALPLINTIVTKNNPEITVDTALIHDNDTVLVATISQIFKVLNIGGCIPYCLFTILNEESKIYREVSRYFFTYISWKSDEMIELLVESIYNGFYGVEQNFHIICGDDKQKIICINNTSYNSKLKSDNTTVNDRILNKTNKKIKINDTDISDACNNFVKVSNKPFVYLKDQKDNSEIIKKQKITNEVVACKNNKTLFEVEQDQNLNINLRLENDKIYKNIDTVDSHELDEFDLNISALFKFNEKNTNCNINAVNRKIEMVMILIRKNSIRNLKIMKDLFNIEYDIHKKNNGLSLLLKLYFNELKNPIKINKYFFKCIKERKEALLYINLVTKKCKEYDIEFNWTRLFKIINKNNYKNLHVIDCQDIPFGLLFDNYIISNNYKNLIKIAIKKESDVNIIKYYSNMADNGTSKKHKSLFNLLNKRNAQLIEITKK